jgi:multicomponent K+:H+ antiporter subunit F
MMPKGWLVLDVGPVLAWAVGVTLVLYAAAIGLALVRVFRGPSAQDRVLALDFIYVVGMLIILVLGMRYQTEYYFEAALLIALFGFVSSAAFAKFLLRGEVIE